MMTRRDVATLAFKLFALWLIARDVEILGTFIGAFMQTVFKSGWRSTMGAGPSWFDVTTVALAPVVVMALAGILLWWKARPLAKRIFPREEATVDSSVKETSYQAWLGMGICLTGLWLFSTAIITLTIFLVQRPAIAERFKMEPQPLLSDSDFLGYMTRLLVGLCMILGSRGLSRLLWKVRHGGLEDVAEQTSTEA